MAKGRHPAYADPNYPTNTLLGYMGKAENRVSWAEPCAIAAAMYRLVSRGERIPFLFHWVLIPMIQSLWNSKASRIWSS